jgi:chaperonin cofactor prefoldin
MSFLTKSDADIIKNLNKDIASIGKQLKTCEHALHQANSHNETIKEIIRQK